eukprot:582992-Hanusia_phi.AAC.5
MNVTTEAFKGNLLQMKVDYKGFDRRSRHTGKLKSSMTADSNEKSDRDLGINATKGRNSTQQGYIRKSRERRLMA